MGISQRDFSRALLSAQRKVAKREPLTEREAEVWRIATDETHVVRVISFRPA